MMNEQDQRQLNLATELVLDVVARHRGEDLRALMIFSEVVQGIRVATRYLGVGSAQSASSQPPSNRSRS